MHVSILDRTAQNRISTEDQQVENWSESSDPKEQAAAAYILAARSDDAFQSLLAIARQDSRWNDLPLNFQLKDTDPLHAQQAFIHNANGSEKVDVNWLHDDKRIDVAIAAEEIQHFIDFSTLSSDLQFIVSLSSPSAILWQRWGQRMAAYESSGQLQKDKVLFFNDLQELNPRIVVTNDTFDENATQDNEYYATGHDESYLNSWWNDFREAYKNAHGVYPLEINKPPLNIIHASSLLDAAQEASAAMEPTTVVTCHRLWKTAAFWLSGVNARAA